MSDELPVEAINGGTRFYNWCVGMGRPEPPADIVEALNRSMDEGTKAIKALIPSNSEVWENYQSYLAGVGRRRV